MDRPPRIDPAAPRARRNECSSTRSLNWRRFGADLSLEETVWRPDEPPSDRRARTSSRSVTSVRSRLRVPEQHGAVTRAAIDALPRDPDIRRLVEDPDPPGPSPALDRRDPLECQFVQPLDALDAMHELREIPRTVSTGRRRRGRGYRLRSCLRNAASVPPEATDLLCKRLARVSDSAPSCPRSAVFQT